MVSKLGSGVLSFSLSNNDGVATIDGDTVTIGAAGTANITVTIAASADGVYAQATTSATLTVNTQPQAVISFKQGQYITITSLVDDYLVADYVESTNSSQPLMYSYNTMNPYIEFWDDRGMGGIILNMSPHTPGGPVPITVSQNGDSNFLAPVSVTLYVTVN